MKKTTIEIGDNLTMIIMMIIMGVVYYFFK